MRWSKNCSNTKSCPTINCTPNILKILNSWTRNKYKLIWNAIAHYLKFQPPSKDTPSWPIKVWSMISTMKKTFVKSTDQPVNILQYMPSTSKWSKFVTHHRKRDWSERHRYLRQNFIEQYSNSESKEANLQLIHWGPSSTVLASRDCELHWKTNNVTWFQKVSMQVYNQR